MNLLNRLISGGILIIGGTAFFLYRTGTPAAAASVASAAPAASWTVSQGYTIANKRVPNTVLADVKSSGGDHLTVRCSPGFTAAYVLPVGRPAPEEGTETATFTMRIDNGAEVVGHARMVDSDMVIGDASTVKKLALARTLGIRFTPLVGDGALKSMDFDLRGLPGAMAEMRQVCGAL